MEATRTTKELLSAEVFKMSQPKLPEGSKQRTIQLTRQEESKIKQRVEKDLSDFEHLLLASIVRTYGNLPCHVAEDVAHRVTEKFKANLGRNSLASAALSDPLLEKLEHVFIESTSRDTAHLRLRAYVERSWREYQFHPNDFKAPYVAITQSSGTGKNRGVQELAQVASKEKGGSMGVLYVCTRLKESTGFPKATPRLQEWLFDEDQPKDTSVKVPEERLANHLVTIYIYAQKH
ncbi:hypothetical protein PHYSODRAFT_342116 [Phytophthora sojae]|uniref:Uncharacterized protein n=1 Tax=Phytophthora sojae (strain P6497) TaxID=1094619 RepID=G5AFC5_PHYSP|nr:hypothetical protein PHYSODRAFT_342116 [Phytophthora sojae]EGZ05915.1 hypothetical protein PHYSODRAFT_342116 [Phytophthora sojae]|eukprot:XP_009538776.1 hypothetical protein PHYSODRAFT_342116 [Phytophthora sojae]